MWTVAKKIALLVRQQTNLTTSENRNRTCPQIVPDDIQTGVFSCVCAHLAKTLLCVISGTLIFANVLAC